MVCVGVRSPNLFGCRPELGLRLGEKLAGAKVDWNGTPEPKPFDAGVEVGIGLGENEVGANVFWKGLLEGPAVGPGVGLGAKVEGNGLRVGPGVGLGRGVLGAKVLLGNDVANGGVVGPLFRAGRLDGPGRGLFDLGVSGDERKGLLVGLGRGLIGCLPGFGDWKGRLSIGNPLALPMPFKEFPNAGRPLPPEPPNALPCLTGGLENPLSLLCCAPNAFPSLPPVPPQAGTSQGQLQIRFTSSKANPNGHLNS